MRKGIDMRELTKAEQTKLDKAVRNCTYHYQLFRVIWWSWFYPNKAEKLIAGVMDGKSWRFAYEDAKKG